MIRVQLQVPHRATQKLNCMTESIAQMLHELQQVQYSDHFSGEHVPVPKHPLGRVLFPNNQLDPPLMHLHPIPSGYILVKRVTFEEAVCFCEASLSLPYCRLNKPIYLPHISSPLISAELLSSLSLFFFLPSLYVCIDGFLYQMQNLELALVKLHVTDEYPLLLQSVNIHLQDLLALKGANSSSYLVSSANLVCI